MGTLLAFWALAMSIDGQSLVSGGADSTLIIWSVANRTARQVHSLKLSSRIRTVACSHDGRIVSVGCDDGALQVYESMTDNLARKFQIKLETAVKSLAFSPDASKLAAGRGDGRIELYGVDERAKNLMSETALLGHSGPVNSIGLSADGNKLISGSSDKSIRLWDLTNPERDPVILQDHQWWVWSVAMNPKSEAIISGSADKTIRVWNVSTKNLADRVCDVVGRNLSRAEWTEFIGEDVDYVQTCPNLPAGKGIQSKVSSTSR